MQERIAQFDEAYATNPVGLLITAPKAGEPPFKRGNPAYRAWSERGGKAKWLAEQDAAEIKRQKAASETVQTPPTPEVPLAEVGAVEFTASDVAVGAAATVTPESTVNGVSVPHVDGLLVKGAVPVESGVLNEI